MEREKGRGREVLIERTNTNYVIKEGRDKAPNMAEGKE
jgi:hypothetical protein